MEKRYVVNSVTGEIEDELLPGDKIRRMSQDNYYKGMEEMFELNKDKAFVKLYNDTMAILGQEKMTLAEYRVCFMLLKYINYGSGVLRYENNGRELNLTDIEKITGLSRSTVSRAMKGLISKRIYGVHKTGKENCYTVNPFIFMKGKYVNKTLYDFFKKSKWAKL